MTDHHVAMFPGSFDPPTLGHVNIIRRSLRLYDRLYVVVADNISKKCLFTAQERVDMLKDIFRDSDNIVVVSYDGLMVDFARRNGIGVMIRGVRAMGDFSYEFELAMTNKQMMSDLEVLLSSSCPPTQAISCSALHRSRRWPPSGPTYPRSFPSRSSGF